ncbi:ATP-dependent DNA helicase [Frankliniella fusca]|uniref:ATP-dependent DNA helicase n=1 Tax=Frankliniella fusca TaxID=407009 RepID=A0AAE1L879_9NEOP|nr:ATP-dependent DNA helicase [Frankliniella fusca]
MFSSREISTLAQQGIHPPSDAFTLVETNVQVSRFNEEFLRTLDTETCYIPSMDTCLGEGSARERQRELDKVQEWPLTKTQGLPRELQGTVSAPYMVTVNLSTRDGLTNGSCGTLRHIQWGRTGDGQRTPIRLYLEFTDETVGRQARADNRAIMASDGVNASLTPIERVSKTIIPRKGSLLKIVRKQFPLVVCKAMTIHKCQGSTMPAVIVVIREERRMDRRSFYVGASRPPSLTGLHILGKYRRPSPPLPNDPVILELQRLELPENAVQFSINFPELNADGEGAVALFHNIVSLHKHHNHVVQDLSYTGSDIVMLCETRTMSQDDVSIPGFQLLHRRDCIKATRHPYGTSLYVKHRLAGQVSVIFAKPSLNEWRGGHLQSFVDVVGLVVSGWTKSGIVFLHRSPQCSMSLFKQHLTDCLQCLQQHEVKSITVVGDFNINFKEIEAAQTLLAYMRNFGLNINVNESDVSTDSSTLIDLCFSNVPGDQAHITESVISDHKPVWFKLNDL